MSPRLLRLEQALTAGELIPLPGPGEEAELAAALASEAPAGPAFVLGSGGSSGGRRWMQLELAALEAAADGLAQWLQGLGIDPAACLCLDPLPLHHVSGLMPWLRARRWGARLQALAPPLLRDPALLAQACPLPSDRPVLVSLVPTQLLRLLERPEGVRWLAGCAVIWVGGAALPPELANRCRRLALPLSPCYGSTETGAMVAALPPERFLAGEPGCGPALPHAQLRLAGGPDSGPVEVRTPSLAVGEHRAGQFLPLPLREGWWCSGDRGRLAPSGGLELLGRLDRAISSGGETVFPEQVERRLQQWATQAGLPLAQLLLLAEPDPLWGERLVALVRAMPDPAAAGGGAGAGSVQALLVALRALAADLPPSQRPRRWLSCPELAPSALGKWQRQRWQRWLAARPPDAQG